MVKKSTIAWTVLIVVVAIISAFTFLARNQDEIYWEEAVELIQSGQVSLVMQTHSGEVTLKLKDGRTVKTQEPSIDAIFQEIIKCGDKCQPMTIATE